MPTIEGVKAGKLPRKGSISLCPPVLDAVGGTGVLWVRSYFCVLGVLPGIIGLLQATETIKLLLNIGEPLVGRLTTYDALSGEFNELRLFRDPNCAACGVNGNPVDLPTYADVCAIPA